MFAPLNERFCLKGDRKNFSIDFRNNSEDRAAYFGKRKMNEAIIQSIRSRYMMGNQPKKILYGQYGAGKTHTLFNIMYQLQDSEDAKKNTSYEIKCCFIDAEFKEKTDYNYLHTQMMEAMTLERVREITEEYLAKNAGPDLEEKLRNEFGGDANIARAIRALGFAGEPITLWKWLCGGMLTPAELTSYHLTKNMDTVSEMYRVLTGIARLFFKKNVYYLFLLDEMEGLDNIRKQDCRESFHDAFRKLADDDNNVVGFIISIYAMREEDIPEFVFREDVITRLNRENIHSLEYLAEDGIRQFLKELFSLVVDEEKKKKKEEGGQIPKNLEYYPLTDDAMDEFVNLAVSAPVASLPRNFISALNEGAINATHRDSNVIDVQDLVSAQNIFTESTT